MKKKVIVMDIDGVVFDTSAIHSQIHELKLKGDDMWNYFHSRCNDENNKLIDETLEFALHIHKRVPIILSTARNEKCRKSTERRLLLEQFPYDSLYMRDFNDERPSWEVKQDHLKEISEKYKILAFIDDELRNCEMARDMGILSLRKV